MEGVALRPVETGFLEVAFRPVVEAFGEVAVDVREIIGKTADGGLVCVKVMGIEDETVGIEGKSLETFAGMGELCGREICTIEFEAVRVVPDGGDVEEEAEEE